MKGKLHLQHLIAIFHSCPAFFVFGFLSSECWNRMKGKGSSRHSLINTLWLESLRFDGVYQWLTFPFPFVHHQPRDRKRRRLKTHDIKTQVTSQSSVFSIFSLSSHKSIFPSLILWEERKGMAANGLFLYVFS